MKKFIIAIIAAFAFYIIKTVLTTDSIAQIPAPNSGISIQLSGHLNGTYERTDVAWSRIQNPLLASNSTFGMFTDPPSPGQPFDIALVLGNIGAAEIDTGTYGIIEVINDVPLLIPPTKGGFMTIVPTGQSVPREEFFTRAGTFTVDSVSASIVAGRFNVSLGNADNSKTIQAEGSFYQPLN